MSEEGINRNTTSKAEAIPEPLTFESASAKLIGMGEQLMRENSERENRKYHTIEHPHTLEKRAEKVAEVFNLTERQKMIVKIAIAWHDTIIIVKPPEDPNDVTAMATRNRGARAGDQPGGAEGNEALSARALKEEIEKVNERAGRAVFSEDDIKVALFAVEATYPDTSFSPFRDYSYFEKIAEQNPRVAEVVDWLGREKIDKGLLFFQPHLEKVLEDGGKIPPEVFVMVLDDLGGAGMAEREEFATEGDKEFQELHVNIDRHLGRLLGGDEALDEADRQKAAEKMIGWLKTQPGFVTYQMMRIEKIIYLLKKNGQLDDAKANELRLSFGRFEDNVKATFDRARNTEKEYRDLKGREGSKEAFRYLAQAMHYKI